VCLSVSYSLTLNELHIYRISVSEITKLPLDPICFQLHLNSVLFNFHMQRVDKRHQGGKRWINPFSIEALINLAGTEVSNGVLTSLSRKIKNYMMISSFLYSRPRCRCIRILLCLESFPGQRIFYFLEI